MTRFARSGTTLHLALDTGGVRCAASNTQPVDVITRDDTLCGRCMDTMPVTNDAGIPFADDGAVERLRAMPYAAYLRTHHWQVIRRAALDHYGPCCLLCGETGQVDVHHRDYSRRGQERLHDLTILCRSCHERYHREAA